MRLVTYQFRDDVFSGILQSEVVHSLGSAPLQDWLGKAPEELLDQQGDTLPLEEIRLLQPILRPGKILALALNYVAHAAESVSFTGMKAGGTQKWFNKQVTAAHPPYGEVHLPRVSECLDYEAELVVVIGKPGRHVPAERAWEIVAGLSCGCDYSVRDWQKASPTMMMGKGFDTHAPVGPASVTLDETPALEEMEIRGLVNGELRQHALASDMVHSIPEQIAHLSTAFTLEPGDVIFTGTPAGVGQGFEPPKFLKAGDTMRVEIDGIGHIEHTVVPEPDTRRIG